MTDGDVKRATIHMASGEILIMNEFMDHHMEALGSGERWLAYVEGTVGMMINVEKIERVSFQLKEDDDG